MIKKWRESGEENRTIKKSDAIKEARDLYFGITTVWTEKEFIEDYLNALEEDGYILV